MSTSTFRIFFSAAAHDKTSDREGMEQKALEASAVQPQED